MLQKPEHTATAAAAPAEELARRSLAVVLAQSGRDAATGLLMGVLFGLVYVPAAGWAAYLAWMVPFSACMLGRQPYFRRLAARAGAAPATLPRILAGVAFSSWLGPLSVPLLAPALGLAELGVVTVVSVGWVGLAAAVLAVNARAYGAYLAASLATVWLAWLPHAGARELALLALGLLLGGHTMAQLGRAWWGELRDSVVAAQEQGGLAAQLRQALQDALEAQRARSRFLGAASHDLRQPVQALLFLTDLFRRASDAARRDAMAQQIMRTGESIDGMLRQLLELAQIDAGTLRARIQPVRLDPLVAASVAGYADRCAARGLRFRLEMGGSCTVEADPVLLDRIVRNLLDNALKYSQHGEIVLRVGPVADAAVRLSVTDQGLGMEQEDLAQAGHAFFRGRSAEVAQAEGLGLGLAICRHIAALMGCALELQSRAGQGTCAGIRLPLAGSGEASVAAGPAGGDPAGEAAGAEAQPLLGWSLAVLTPGGPDDEALCDWLAQAGARVVQAPDLPRLERALLQQGGPPDCLLADLGPHGSTGGAAMQSLREHFGAVPLLLLCGGPDPGEPDVSVPILHKPFTPQRLLEALHAARSQGAGGGEGARSRSVSPARARA